MTILIILACFVCGLWLVFDSGAQYICMGGNIKKGVIGLLIVFLGIYLMVRLINGAVL